MGSIKNLIREILERRRRRKLQWELLTKIDLGQKHATEVVNLLPPLCENCEIIEEITQAIGQTEGNTMVVEDVGASIVMPWNAPYPAPISLGWLLQLLERLSHDQFVTTIEVVRGWFPSGEEIRPMGRVPRLFVGEKVKEIYGIGAKNGTEGASWITFFPCSLELTTSPKSVLPPLH